MTLYLYNINRPLTDTERAILPAERVEKAERMSFDNDKALSLAVGFLLAKFGGRGVFHSIAHTREYAVLAVSDCPIGIDIEHSERNFRLKTMARCFTDEEIAWCNAASSNRLRIKRCIEIWTRLEARFKLCSANELPCDTDVAYNTFEYDGYLITTATQLDALSTKI
ncbi:MAG: 4'-phosphopantetheinyl transferase superfamily protein [Oscillospiraceae bacterium]|jgi:hypothetical protein|nr:4'-phosphopantetheinyl transferase superfamily protein [Oscillospiraceae bacterium]